MDDFHLLGNRALSRLSGPQQQKLNLRVQKLFAFLHLLFNLGRLLPLLLYKPEKIKKVKKKKVKTKKGKKNKKKKSKENKRETGQKRATLTLEISLDTPQPIF
jgi:hypothetical protein